MAESGKNSPSSEDPKVLYADACRLARSHQETDLGHLLARLTDTAFLGKLDTAQAYEDQSTRLRVAGVLQVLSENSAPMARKVLLALASSLAFLEHRSRVELLIQALVTIRPAPRESVLFWDKHFEPEDGYSSVTVWALLSNGSPPAIALFEERLRDSRFSEGERSSWLTACVLQYRNDLPLIEACQRLLDSPLEDAYRLLLVDVLFDYKPDEWYGARHWHKPPPRAKATPQAMEQLRALGQKALQNQPLSKPQQEVVQRVIKELDDRLQEK